MPPKSIEEHKTAGNEAFAKGNTDAAKKAYSAAITAMEEECARTGTDVKAHPQAAALYSNRSACNHKLCRFRDALADAEAAIAAKPDWWKGYMRAAYAAEGMGDDSKCTAYLRGGLDVDPENVDLKSRLAELEAEATAEAERRQKAFEETPEAGKMKRMLKKVGRSSTSSTPFFVNPAWITSLRGDKPRKGSRRGKTLLVRPSVLTGSPLKEGGPMFFPAVPEWDADVPLYLSRVFKEGSMDGLSRELYMLGELASGAWVNQRTADVEHRRANKIPAKCDFCEIDLSKFGESGPSCECGEQYCSRECLYLDYKNHQSICSRIREESEFVPQLHMAYWDAVIYGHASWKGERIKNYSIQYHAKRKEKGIPDTTREVHAPKNEDDVAVDELSYLMNTERKAVMEGMSAVQSDYARELRNDNKDAADQFYNALIGLALELHVRYANYDAKYDTPFRAEFKWFMSQMSYDNVLKPFGLQRYVEPYATTKERLSPGTDLMKNEPEGIKSFIANCATLKMK